MTPGEGVPRHYPQSPRGSSRIILGTANVGTMGLDKSDVQGALLLPSHFIFCPLVRPRISLVQQHNPLHSMMCAQVRELWPLGCEQRTMGHPGGPITNYNSRSSYAML
jgi:hypothetical protein